MATAWFIIIALIALVVSGNVVTSLIFSLLLTFIGWLVSRYRGP